MAISAASTICSLQLLPRLTRSVGAPMASAPEDDHRAGSGGALTFITEHAAPVELAVAQPRLAVAEAVFAARVGDTLVAELPLPARLAPGSGGQRQRSVPVYVMGDITGHTGHTGHTVHTLTTHIH